MAPDITAWDLATVFAIGFALSLDTFSVTIALGTKKRKGERGTFREAATLSGIFSAFHFAMPLAGYFAGSAAKTVFTNIDHWIAFLLLAFIGGKMVIESRKAQGRRRNEDSPAKWGVFETFSVAIATSIDAFAIGMTIAFLKLPILASAGIIALTNLAVSFAGVYFGRFLGEKFKEKAELAGGVVLVAIGAKVLAEHLLNVS